MTPWEPLGDSLVSPAVGGAGYRLSKEDAAATESGRNARHELPERSRCASMRTIATLAFASSLLAGSGTARADDEITPFDGRGRASAYIAPDDEGTIYLWSGKPVAYLDADSASGFHICGFNGKHLGWFVGGIVRAHDGNAACAVKERLRSTQFEPFKGFKQFKPFKGFKEFAPRSLQLFRPIRLAAFS
jgi:hypothetical protein